jgi:hypothetical protein
MHTAPLPVLKACDLAVRAKVPPPKAIPRHDILPELISGIPLIALQVVPPFEDRRTVPESPTAMITPFPALRDRITVRSWVEL